VRVEVTKRAQREVNRLGRWWLENRDKAPELFEEELSAAYFRIATDPTGQAVHGKPWPPHSASADGQDQEPRLLLPALAGHHSSGVRLGRGARAWSEARRRTVRPPGASRDAGAPG
jgi:hypothetical protein